MSVQKYNFLLQKIVIVGAGPAGSLAALKLKEQGFKNVTLIERKKSVERKVCGEYLCPKGVELLDNLGLTNELCFDFNSLHGMVLCSPDNDVIPSYFPTPKNSEKGLSLNRQLFDQRLLNKAVSTGVTFLNDKTLVNLTKNEKGYSLLFQDGSSMECDLLIAADGRQSKIGHLLGHIKEINTKRAAVHCYLPRKSQRGLRLGEMHILNYESYCGIDPISDDEVNFSIVCNSERLKHETPRQIINKAITNSPRLSECFSPMGEALDKEIKIVTTLRNNNTHVAGDAIAYVGDAAGFIDPLTGEGIYNALLSSHLLVESLCLSASTDQNVAKALSRYKRKKWKVTLEKKILNHFFQLLITKPLLVKWTVQLLKTSSTRADIFIGIIGNIYNPLTGLLKMLKV